MGLCASKPAPEEPSDLPEAHFVVPEGIILSEPVAPVAVALALPVVPVAAPVMPVAVPVAQPMFAFASGAVPVAQAQMHQEPAPPPEPAAPPPEPEATAADVALVVRRVAEFGGHVEESEARRVLAEQDGHVGKAVNRLKPRTTDAAPEPAPPAPPPDAAPEPAPPAPPPKRPPRPPLQTVRRVLAVNRLKPRKTDAAPGPAPPVPPPERPPRPPLQTVYHDRFWAFPGGKFLTLWDRVPPQPDAGEKRFLELLDAGSTDWMLDRLLRISAGPLTQDGKFDDTIYVVVDIATKSGEVPSSMVRDPWRVEEQSAEDQPRPPWRMCALHITPSASMAERLVQERLLDAAFTASGWRKHPCAATAHTAHARAAACAHSPPLTVMHCVCTTVTQAL